MFMSVKLFFPFPECLRELRGGVLQEVESVGGEGAVELADLQAREVQAIEQLDTLLVDIQAFKNAALDKVTTECAFQIT